MDLRSYLQTFRRRWRVVVASFLVVLAVVAGFTLRETREYASTAQLFISTPSSDSGGVDAYQGSLFSAQRVASYADLVTGKTLTEQVVQRLHLSESAEALSKQVSASAVANTVLLDVTVTDPSPKRARYLAGAIARQFTSYVRQLETPPGQHVPPIKATIVDPPTAPTSPVSPRVGRNLVLGTVLGLLLGLGLAVLRESLDTSIKAINDLSSATGASFLGHIPFDKDALRVPLISELDLHAPRAESTRMLRTNLQFIEVDQRSKVFVVTSSVPEEGKTTTAINLAIASAKTGQSVLLLEGDLRRPRVADYLRLEPTVGLTTVLIGRVDLEDAIQTWGDDGLDVLTSGAKPPNPAELVHSVAMLTTLEKLRDRYDLIIVDAPPLLPVTDGALLAAQADGAILVVRFGKTTRDQLAQAAHHLSAVDARLLGTVLNMARSRAGDGYSTGYGYGYGYGAEPAGRHTRKPAREPLRTTPE